MIELSDKESELLGCIRSYWENTPKEAREAPSIGNLAQMTGRYYVEVWQTLQALDRIGFIELDCTERHVRIVPLWWE